jgi:hypothetical protein
MSDITRDFDTFKTLSPEERKTVLEIMKLQLQILKQIGLPVLKQIGLPVILIRKDSGISASDFNET